MTAPVDLSSSPLLDARELLAAHLTAQTGLPCFSSYTQAFTTPCYVLQGAGWGINNNGIVVYKITVACLYAGQAGDTGDVVEEMARLATIACAGFNAGVFDVPAVGTVNVGEARDYPGIVFTAHLPVTLT